MENDEQREEIILLILDFLKSINFTASLDVLRAQAEREFQRRFDESTYRTMPRGLLMDSVRFVANHNNVGGSSSSQYQNNAVVASSGLINRAYGTISSLMNRTANQLSDDPLASSSSLMKPSENSNSIPLHKAPAKLLEARIKARMIQKELSKQDKLVVSRSVENLQNSLLKTTREIAKLRELSKIHVLNRNVGSNASPPGRTFSQILSRNSFGDKESRERLELFGIRKIGLLKRISAHYSSAYCISTCGDSIVTGADDGLVKVFDSFTGSLTSVLRGHQDVLVDIACFGEETIASASNDCTVRVWNKNSARCLVALMGHKKPVQRVAFAKNGNTLLSCADDGCLALWSLGDIHSQIRHEDSVFETRVQREMERRRLLRLQQQQQLDSSSSSSTTAAPTLLPPVNLINTFIATQAPPTVLPHWNVDKNEPLSVGSLSIHPNGEFVVTGASDSIGRVWCIEEIALGVSHPVAECNGVNLLNCQYLLGAKRHLCSFLRGHSNGMMDVSWSNDGNRVLSFSDTDATARIWFWLNENQSESFSSSSSSSRPANSLLTKFTSKPQHLVLHAVTTPHGGSKPSAQTIIINAACFTCDDSLVVTSQQVKLKSYEDQTAVYCNQRIVSWDSKSGELLHVMRGHYLGGVSVVKPHPRLNNVVATCGLGQTVFLWNVASGAELARINVCSLHDIDKDCMLDARWVALPSCDFIGVDSHGRLLLFGNAAHRAFEATYPEQYFKCEGNEVDTHANGVAYDRVTQLPVHLNYSKQLVDFFGDPIIGGGSLTKLAAAREREKMIATGEMQKQEEKNGIIKKLVEQLERARESERQGERQEEKKKDSKSGGVKERKKKPEAGLLALEKHTTITINDDDDEDDDDDEEEEEEAEQRNGRQKRAAARKASRKIHQQVEYTNEDDESSAKKRTRHADREEAEAEVSSEEELSSFEGDDSLVSSEDSFGEEDGGVYRERRRSHRRRRVERGELRLSLRERKKVRYTDLPNSEGEEDPAPVKRSGAYNREWLLRREEGLQFVPQSGDRVVYFVQGHKEFLSLFPSLTTPPWEVWKEFAWAFTLCEIESVEYFYPVVSQTNPINAIVCKCELKLVGVPNAEVVSMLDFEEGEVKYFSPPPPPRAPKKREEEIDWTEFRFKVDYNLSSISDFIVLESRFVAGMAIGWMKGDLAKVPFVEANEGVKDYRATVVNVSVVEEDLFANSPWECLEVKWSESGTLGRISPWEGEIISRKYAYSSTPIKMKRDVPWKCLPQSTLEFHNHPALPALALKIATSPVSTPFLSLATYQNGRKDIRTLSFPSPILIDVELLVARLQNKYYRQLEALWEDVKRVRESFSQLKVEEEVKFGANEWEVFAAVEIERAMKGGRDDGEGGVIDRGVVVKKLEALMETLCNEFDPEGIFAEPVPLDVAGYYDTIRKPMDFSTVKQKLNVRFAYDSSREEETLSEMEARKLCERVLSDLVLICDNCTLFNDETSYYHMAARNMREWLRENFLVEEMVRNFPRRRETRRRRAKEEEEKKEKTSSNHKQQEEEEEEEEEKITTRRATKGKENDRRGASTRERTVKVVKEEEEEEEEEEAESKTRNSRRSGRMQREVVEEQKTPSRGSLRRSTRLIG